MRLWQQGLLHASRWAVKAAREGITVPIPRRILARLAERADDPSLADLRLAVRDGAILEVTGRKKAGVWVDFRARFRVEAPAAGDPPRALVLRPEEVQPFLAKGPMLAALGQQAGARRDGDRVRIDLDEVLQGHEWRKKVPDALRERLRIGGVESADGQLKLRLQISAGRQRLAEE
ncbi:hypothetical protein SAMN05660831_01373 [Thiohalospira halophila DSM 15071]|uniref:Uncharacterized protein n=1 Tax=Thiohalospira halophila DSM 15071 TaxID=1123397 RepID=A0A1I1R8X3_9GAMM|nr:hypothetical protein [Thiohalospira halophila]SFD30854.1 hypothetical protein SAMN05660831_01373 [Thiohalospira halophila DSM 15071]